MGFILTGVSCKSVKKVEIIRDKNSTNQNKTVLAVQASYTVKDCQIDGVSEDCYWRYRYNPNVCGKDTACSKLVIFFSGGEMGCDEGETQENFGYNYTLNRYTADGYVAVCAGLFLNWVPAGQQPYNDQAIRTDRLVQAITTAESIRQLWDGKYLLFAGVSHGGTTPVIAMARTAYDSQSTWKASRFTAACFHDAIYDILVLDDFLSANAASCALIRNFILCQRYFGTLNCAQPITQTSEVLEDSVTSVSVSNFSIRDWKLIECGSGVTLPACEINNGGGDWIPAAPIQALCNNISAQPGYSCTFGSQPLDGHLACANSERGVDQCKVWFNSKLPS